MPLTVLAPQEPALVAPVEAQPSNPTEAVVAAPGVTIRTGTHALSATPLRSPNPAFRGHSVVDPREQQARQYAEDEQAGILRQAHRLVEVSPGSATAWARLAQALVTQGVIDEAIAAASKVVALVPADAASSSADVQGALFVAARTFAVAGDEGTAEELLRKLSSPGPWTVLHAVLAERRGDHTQALARLDGDETAEAAAFRGYLWLQVGKPAKALAELRQAHRLGNLTPSLLLNLAYAFAATGSPRKAVSYARQATHIAPDSRQASFNLASYLRGVGDVESAILELRRLARIVGEGDAQVAAAVANALIGAGKAREALRELRRAEHHNVFAAGSIRYAELTANAALLEWLLGDRTRDDLLTVIRGQLESAGSHLPLVLMLCDVLNRSTALPELETHYRVLAQRSTELELAPLEVRMLLLRGALGEAATLATRFAEAFPLDVVAVRGALVLEAQVFGRYGEAAESGLKALRRMPGDPMLGNNVAFCLALAGRGADALAVLKRFPQDDPYLLATRGLAYLSLGAVDKGLRLYDKAAELARNVVRRPEDSDDFERLLRLQELVAQRQFGLFDSADSKSVAPPMIPSDWMSDPRYILLRSVCERVSEPWPAVEAGLDNESA